jgi:hypothetical protein
MNKQHIGKDSKKNRIFLNNNLRLRNLLRNYFLVLFCVKFCKYGLVENFADVEYGFDDTNTQFAEELIHLYHVIFIILIFIVFFIFILLIRVIYLFN